MRQNQPEQRSTKTGLSAIGDIGWGTHLCHFFETKDDLLELVVPYFKAGLENNEYGFWVLDDCLTLDEAMSALRAARIATEVYLPGGRIETLQPGSSHSEKPARAIELVSTPDWYLEGGTFAADRVIEGWNRKISEAQAKGFAGVRVNASVSWLTPKEWEAFLHYERSIDQSMAGTRMIALCSYPIAKASATQILDLAQTHAFVVAKRNGQWTTLEVPELKQAKRELASLNEQLERRVTERTEKLKAANADLVQEIGERTSVENALRRSERRFRKMFAANPAPGAIVGIRDRKYRDVNEAFVETFGHTRAEAIGKTGCELGIWYDKDEQERAWQTFLTDRSLKAYETRLRTKTGEVMDTVLYAEAIELDDEPCFIASIIDITERKLGEKILRQSQQLLHLVLQTLPVGVTVIDSNGDIALVNDALNSIWGGIVKNGRKRWSQSKGYWHGSGERIEAADWASVRALTKGETIHNELIDIETFHGQRKIMRNSAAPIRDAEGDIVGAVVVNEDVTDRVQAEEGLRDAHKQLRILSRRRVQVQEEERRHLARELHDHIGQLVTAAKINVQSARGTTNIRRVREKLAETARILDDVLEQARQISFALRPSTLDDLGLAPAIRSMLVEAARATGITAEFVAPPDLRRADAESETACYRVAAEAVTNAVRHAKPRKISIALRNVNHSIRLEVRDDGSGFEVQKIDRAADRDRLGVIGMRERAFAVGGRFEINSQPGQGTEVIADFPISAAPDSAS